MRWIACAIARSNMGPNLQQKGYDLKASLTVSGCRRMFKRPMATFFLHRNLLSTGGRAAAIVFLCATVAPAWPTGRLAAQGNAHPGGESGAGGSIRRTPIASLVSDIRAITADRPFADASWGVSVVSCDNGEVLVDLDGSRNRQVASNMKLLTTATALAVLGGDRRFTTEVYVGRLVDDGLPGEDIVIRTMGDPSISPSFGTDPREVLAGWCRVLDSLGISRVRNIIVDATRYESTPYGPGWNWDDEQFGFSAPISAAAIYDNCVEVRVTPGDAPGSPARIDLIPPTAYVSLQVTAQTARVDEAGAIEVRRERGSDIVTVAGLIAVGAEPFIEHIAIDDPPAFFGTLMQEEMERRHIVVLGSVVDVDNVKQPIPYSSLRRIVIRRSEPLRELLPAINKQSLNLASELLLREMGFDDVGTGTTAAGVEVVKRMVRDAGIDPERLKIVDGSGLSRLNMIAPADITRFLRSSWRARWGSDYRASFAVAGRDGTLAQRLRGSRAEGNAIGKTGYLNGIRAISGFVRSRDGEWLAFSVVVNNYSVPTIMVNTAQDLIVMRLASFTRK